MRGARCVLALGTFSMLLWVGALPSTAAQPFEAFFHPPGLLLRGEKAGLIVDVGSPPPGLAPDGDAYVRGASKGAFTRLRLVWDDAREALGARVPAGALGGSVLDSYVVVHDPVSGETVTIPPKGQAAPYQTWIIGPATLHLPKLRFGHRRPPDAVVVRAHEGSGPSDVGVFCTGENECEGPPTFDVASDGTVWIADTLNGRLQVWAPGHTRDPTRTIKLDVTPSDIAIGSDGTIYLSGCCAPDHFHNVLRAMTRGGRTLWETPLLGEIYNDQIRVGSNGVVYTQDVQYGWAPATDASGHPLSLARQRRLVQPYQPVAGGDQLAVTPGPTARDWRVVLATSSGALRQAWHVVGADDTEGAASYAVVDGDAVLTFRVDDVTRHLKEHEVVVLSATGGIADTFSIRWGAALGELPQVTDLRVEPDGDLYLMQTDPKRGISILRYGLLAAQTPTPTTATPTLPSSGTLSGSASASASPVASSSSRTTLLVISLCGLGVGLGLALTLWLRRRGSSHAPG